MTLQQFKKYDEQLKKISFTRTMAYDLDYILNNIWSTYSFHKGKRKWLEICSNVEEPFKSRIQTEIGHVEIGHGIVQARLATKDEMEKYIEYFIEKNIK